MGVIADSDDRLKIADYVGIGVRVGLSVQETLQIPVGLLMDLWELYKKQHGIQPKHINPHDF